MPTVGSSKTTSTGWSAIAHAMLSQRFMPLEPVPQKIWWLILPSVTALYGFFMLGHLSKELLRYAY